MLQFTIDANDARSLTRSRHARESIPRIRLRNFNRCPQQRNLASLKGDWHSYRVAQTSATRLFLVCFFQYGRTSVSRDAIRATCAIGQPAREFSFLRRT